MVFFSKPTSGLDARSALLVVKLLRKIATEGRTICATIHQVCAIFFSSLCSVINGLESMHLTPHYSLPLYSCSHLPVRSQAARKCCRLYLAKMKFSQTFSTTVISNSAAVFEMFVSKTCYRVSRKHGFIVLTFI